METIAQIVPLRSVAYERFKEFLDSLDKERKSWSLDLQGHFKNDKELYEDENDTYAIICVYDEEVIIGFCNCYIDPPNQMIEVSFVVKKEYQSQGIGSSLLKRVEYDWRQQKSTYKYIRAKHYKDNIASHKAFLKAGYKEWKRREVGKKYVEDDTFDWKIKEIE